MQRLILDFFYPYHHNLDCIYQDRVDTVELEYAGPIKGMVEKFIDILKCLAGYPYLRKLRILVRLTEDLSSALIQHLPAQVTQLYFKEPVTFELVKRLAQLEQIQIYRFSFSQIRQHYSYFAKRTNLTQLSIGHAELFGSNVSKRLNQVAPDSFLTLIENNPLTHLYWPYSLSDSTVIHLIQSILKYRTLQFLAIDLHSIQAEACQHLFSALNQVALRKLIILSSNLVFARYLYQCPHVKDLSIDSSNFQLIDIEHLGRYIQQSSKLRSLKLRLYSSDEFRKASHSEYAYSGVLEPGPSGLTGVLGLGPVDPHTKIDRSRIPGPLGKYELNKEDAVLVIRLIQMMQECHAVTHLTFNIGLSDKVMKAMAHFLISDGRLRKITLTNMYYVIYSVDPLLHNIMNSNYHLIQLQVQTPFTGMSGKIRSYLGKNQDLCQNFNPNNFIQYHPQFRKDVQNLLLIHSTDNSFNSLPIEILLMIMSLLP